MEMLLPTDAQLEQINQSRAHQAMRMDQAGAVDGPLTLIEGPCAADSNRHENGMYATEAHNQAMYEAADELPEIEEQARMNGVKPRTRGGTTGLLHQPGGPLAYATMARNLTDAGISLAAEMMDESDAAIAGPWLTTKWLGTRNDQDTGARQLLRPTEDELMQGIVPAVVWVKSAASGILQPSINALHTIRVEKPEARTRFTLDKLGQPVLGQVITHPNLHTGLLLRGQTLRPQGPTDEILEEEILTARELVDGEFGKNVVPIGVDTSHGHAGWEGGGEEGQLAIAESLVRLMGRGVVVDMVMTETYLHAGKQSDGGQTPGLSQVDKCVRQEKAIDVMDRMNAARVLQQLAVNAAL
jgi:phospho-2-dehydro-3-deoxyheptonate aldolase